MTVAEAPKTNYSAELFSPNGEPLDSFIALNSVTENGFIEGLAEHIKSESKRTGEIVGEILQKLTSDKPYYYEISGVGSIPFKMFLTPDKLKKIAALI